MYMCIYSEGWLPKTEPSVRRCSNRVLRGGAFNNNANNTQAGNVNNNNPNNANNNIGFRFAKTCTAGAGMRTAHVRRAP